LLKKEVLPLLPRSLNRKNMGVFFRDIPLQYRSQGEKESFLLFFKAIVSQFQHQSQYSILKYFDRFVYQVFQVFFTPI